MEKKTVLFRNHPYTVRDASDTHYEILEDMFIGNRILKSDCTIIDPIPEKVELPQVGEVWECVKDVIMDDGSIKFIAGRMYKCEADECLTNETGNKYHGLFALDGIDDDPNFVATHFRKLEPTESAKGSEAMPAPIGYVPYQLCPKCNGDGNLMRYNSPALGTDAAPICDVCNGAKIIPMFTINTLK